MLEGEGGNAFYVRVAQMLADVHPIVVVAVFEHTLGYGSGGMLLVREDTDLGSALDEGTVELLPRAAGERNDAHVMVGKQETMGEHLKGVERREYTDVCIRELTLQGHGKAEEEGVA